MNKLEQIQREQIKTDMADFEVGDTVKVNTRVIEGGKERIQAFAGIVIGIKGAGAGKSFTVRKLSYGEGVERVFPFNTPRIASVEVTKRGRVRRAKLNYLRQRVGKEAVQVKETPGR
jgi:large subunit ribosomal protein L19